MNYKDITGSLSKPSKMPGHAYGLPAQECKTGSKLAKVEGSTAPSHKVTVPRGSSWNVSTPLPLVSLARTHPGISITGNAADVTGGAAGRTGGGIG